MWDNAPLLRTLANLLFGLSLVLILYSATRYVLHLSVFPLSSVQLRETPKHVPVTLIERVIKNR